MVPPLNDWQHAQFDVDIEQDTVCIKQIIVDNTKLKFYFCFYFVYLFFTQYI